MRFTCQRLLSVMAGSNYSPVIAPDRKLVRGDICDCGDAVEHSGERLRNVFALRLARDVQPVCRERLVQGRAMTTSNRQNTTRTISTSKAANEYPEVIRHHADFSICPRDHNGVRRGKKHMT